MNLNELIQDEDVGVMDSLPEIESDQTTLLTDSDLYKKINTLFSSLESIKNKVELLNYIKNKTYVNKKLAIEMKDVFKDSTPTNNLSIEAYTTSDSKVNYKESVIFMDSDITKNKDTTTSILKDVFEKGIEQCEKLSDDYIEVIKPKLEERYNEIYLSIADSASDLDLNSILFYNKDTKEFVNVSTLTLKEINKLSESLTDIEDDKDKICFNDFHLCIVKFIELFDKNKVILKSIIAISNSDTPLAMDELYKSTLVDNDVCLKDIFNFYVSSKGQLYISNAETLLDYIINLISFQVKEYMSVKNIPESIANYAFSIENEIVDVKKALEFMESFINGMIEFLIYSKNLFVSLKIL